MMINIRELSLTTLFVVLMFWTVHASGQQAAEPGRDVPMSVPELMTVQSIDLSTGELVLDGQRYVAALDWSGDREQTMMSSQPGEELQVALEDLRPGMQVLVETDGTEASRNHRPLILSIWRSQ